MRQPFVFDPDLMELTFPGDGDPKYAMWSEDDRTLDGIRRRQATMDWFIGMDMRAWDQGDWLTYLLERAAHREAQA